MVGPDIFQLQVQGDGIFFGGQTIQGHVEINCFETISNVKIVHVKLKGLGKVHWKSKKEGRNQTGYHHHRNLEEYINHDVVVHQGSLAAGNHVLPFSFLLPPNLPSSFEGQHGHIRYFIEAKMGRSGLSGLVTFNKRKIQFITINSIADLNVIEKASSPQINSKIKTFGCLCCTSGPISVTVRIPRNGYTPGEFIPISAEVDNLSTKTINCTEARLYQVVTFISKGGYTPKKDTSTRIIQEVHRGQIEAGGSDTWNSLPLSIPPVPPTGLGGCRIIHVSYILEFRVDTSGLGSALVVYTPITIGNIPLRSNFQQISSARIISEQFNRNMVPTIEEEIGITETFAGSYITTPPSQPHNTNQTGPYFSQATYNPTAPTMTPICYSDLPPPSYAAAVRAYDDGRPNQLRSDEDYENTDANWDYNPQYPVWPMPSAPSQYSETNSF